MSLKPILCCLVLTVNFCGLGLAAMQTDTLPSPRFSDSLTQAQRVPMNAGRYRLHGAGIWIPAGLMAYGVVSLHVDALQNVNETVKRWVYTDPMPRKVKLDNYLQYAPAGAVYLLNIAGVHGKNKFVDRTIIYGIANLFVGIIVTPVKHLTAETRPDGSDNLSFPSGHTATAFAAAEFLREEYKDVSVWYGIGGYAAAVATGYLRMSNNKHWLADVVAGAGVGLLSTRVAYLIYPAIKRKFSKKKDLSTIVMPVYQPGNFGIGAVHYF